MSNLKKIFAAAALALGTGGAALASDSVLDQAGQVMADSGLNKVECRYTGKDRQDPEIQCHGEAGILPGAPVGKNRLFHAGDIPDMKADLIEAKKTIALKWGDARFDVKGGSYIETSREADEKGEITKVFKSLSRLADKNDKTESIGRLDCSTDKIGRLCEAQLL